MHVARAQCVTWLLCILQLEHVDPQSAWFILSNAKWNLQSLVRSIHKEFFIVSVAKWNLQSLPRMGSISAILGTLKSFPWSRCAVFLLNWTVRTVDQLNLLAAWTSSLEREDYHWMKMRAIILILSCFTCSILIHKRHKQFWEIFRNECKAPRAPCSTFPMGAMRSSINVCQKIVKTVHCPNRLNLRNCVSCLPARASSLSAGKNITNISRFPFFEIPSRPSQFQCHFLGASRRYAVGVNQRVSACDIRNVQHQIHLEGGLRYGKMHHGSVARYIPLQCVNRIEINHDVLNTTNEQLWYLSSQKYLKMSTASKWKPNVSTKLLESLTTFYVRGNNLHPEDKLGQLFRRIKFIHHKRKENMIIEMRENVL